MGQTGLVSEEYRVRKGRTKSLRHPQLVETVEGLVLPTLDEVVGPDEGPCPTSLTRLVDPRRISTPSTQGTPLVRVTGDL